MKQVEVCLNKQNENLLMEAEKSLKNKHVAFIGGCAECRKDLLNTVVLRISGDFKVYRLAKGITSYEEYLQSIRKVFPIKILGYSSLDDRQLDDVQLDWLSFYKEKILIVIEEIGHFQNKNDLFEIITHYVSWKDYIEKEHWDTYFRLLFSSSTYLDDDYFLYHDKIYKENKDHPQKHLQIIKIYDCTREV